MDRSLRLAENEAARGVGRDGSKGWGDQSSPTLLAACLASLITLASITGIMRFCLHSVQS